jgi:tight adherence protein B
LRAAAVGSRATGSRDAELARVASTADAVLAELAAGALAPDALADARASRPPPMVPADPSAGGAGLDGWLDVAVEVSRRTGAPAAGPVTAVAAAARAELDQLGGVRAAVAATRASTRLLAGLPVLGLLLGHSLGAEPLRFLLWSPAGWGCLGAAAVLQAAGLRWTRRLVATALRAT